MKYEVNNKWIILINENREVFYEDFLESGQIETNNELQSFDSEKEMKDYITENELIEIE